MQIRKPEVSGQVAGYHSALAVPSLPRLHPGVGSGLPGQDARWSVFREPPAAVLCWVCPLARLLPGPQPCPPSPWRICTIGVEGQMTGDNCLLSAACAVQETRVKTIFFVSQPQAMFLSQHQTRNAMPACRF